MFLKKVTAVAQSVLNFFKRDFVKAINIGQILKMKYEANSER